MGRGRPSFKGQPPLECRWALSHELGGAITDDIAAFTNLTTLELSNMGLEGTVPPSIGKLTCLRELYLYFNDHLTVTEEELRALLPGCGRIGV